MSAGAFPARLRAIRSARGMSQKQLSDAAGVSQNAVSQWEAGIREPLWANVVALAAALGVSTDAFLEGEELPADEDEEPPPLRHRKK